MWAKDVYQELMLGYLGDVEAEIEQLANARLQARDLRELYLDLDIVTKRLWRLIGASEVDWEGTRSPLETSCNQLQGVFYRIVRSDALPLASVPAAERRAYRLRQAQKSVQILTTGAATNPMLGV